MALALFVLALTKNNVAALGVVLAMAYVPRVILGWAVAGIIDRLPRRQALLASDVLRAGLVLSIPWVHAYAWTVAAVFAIYCLSMIYQPLIRAIQPEIAGSNEINQKSAARQHSYYAIADLGAYVTAAGVLAFWGIPSAFIVDAATYVGAAFLLQSLNVAPELWQPRSSRHTRFWDDLKEGYRYLDTVPSVRMVMVLSAVVALGVAALNTLMAPLSRTLWHVSSAHYVWLLLSIATGSLVSGLAIERLQAMEHWSLHYLLATGFLLTAAGFGLVLVIPVWWGAAGSLVLAGAGNALYGTALIAWLQQRIPLRMRARVLSIRGIGMGLGGAIGASAIGWIARWQGVGVGVALVTALWCFVGIWSAVSRDLRSVNNVSAAAL